MKTIGEIKAGYFFGHCGVLYMKTDTITQLDCGFDAAFCVNFDTGELVKMKLDEVEDATD